VVSVPKRVVNNQKKPKKTQKQSKAILIATKERTKNPTKIDERTFCAVGVGSTKFAAQRLVSMQN
jgi:hypothetical protein